MASQAADRHRARALRERSGPDRYPIVAGGDRTSVLNTITISAANGNGMAARRARIEGSVKIYAAADGRAVLAQRMSCTSKGADCGIAVPMRGVADGCSRPDCN